MKALRAMQWSIFEVDPEAPPTARPRTRRPVLVVSRETANAALPIVTVLPVAEHRPGRRIYPNEVFLPARAVGLDADPIVMAHETFTIPKHGLSRAVASVNDPQIRSAIRQALRVQLNLDELNQLTSEGPSLRERRDDDAEGAER